MFLLIKPGGHFSVSDIVLQGNLPEGLQHSAEMYAGCVSGAIQKETYLELEKANGFVNVQVQKERRIALPDEIVLQYLSKEEFEIYKSGQSGIFSITVYAEKPDSKPADTNKLDLTAGQAKAACCGVDSECC